MVKFILSTLIFILGASRAFTQIAHQFEFIADSRKPNTDLWESDKKVSKLNPLQPSTFGIVYSRMKEKPRLRRGFRLELGSGAYYSRFVFTRDIGSGPIHYQVDRLVRSRYAELGYKLEWRLNTLKSSELQQKGTYLQIHSGLGLFHSKAPEYYDEQGQATYVQISDKELLFIHGHLFLGLSQRFQFSSEGHVFYALAGMDGFLGAENGYYTQLNSRFGIGVQLRGSK
ncbi:MAG: hypothetical protein ACYC1Q_08225 [Bacteroidia bacterium]